LTTILNGYDVVESVADERRRVAGARVVNCDTDVDIVLDVDLVIDAMSRGSSTPAFLDNPWLRQTGRAPFSNTGAVCQSVQVSIALFRYLLALLPRSGLRRQHPAYPN
jgi:hypothetical protein